MNSSPHFFSPLTIFQIGAVYNAIHRECDQIFRDRNFPLEMDQIPVLLKLHYKGQATQQDISNTLRRDKASVNRTVSLLLKKDLVKVIPDKADKRRTLVDLTTHGRKLAVKANTILEEFDKSKSSKLSEEERTQFNRIMNKLIQAPPM